MDLRLDHLTVTIDGHHLVRELCLDVPPGSVVGLVGPNGSGKSTALRCVYRALKPTSGTIWVGDDDLASLSLRRSAQTVAALTQEGGTDFDFTVFEIVALGRSPHQQGNQPLTAAERDLCHEAMAQLGLTHLAERGILSLSGGERQRVLLARALVQEPRVLILDEPTNHLDVRHQVELLSHLKRTKVTVVIVLHDLNLAAATCDRIGVLSEGSLVAHGTPTEVLTTETMREVFGVEAHVVTHPLTADPQILYQLHADIPTQQAPLAAAEAKGTRP
ncbi:ABC transporter ATP-binding protein [Natronoglycomyces albus]|uniref:ABC transporter ATP-binding protein n=1 Tax=Natronoglycomyces albus TaxID=2811108 RepID=A0A895XJX3_9ACTN|nr:ABC transporter ATP-binding protein [Natronoglycomyces albus]QSB05317.1 ABC transporter ATP-binding protein [Natronoglycomyces albus]